MAQTALSNRYYFEKKKTIAPENLFLIDAYDSPLERNQTEPFLCRRAASLVASEKVRNISFPTVKILNGCY